MKPHPFRFKHVQESLGFLLWQTTISWQRKIKQILQAYELTHAQFVIMATLLWFESQDKTPTQALIARWSKLDKMSVSASLKELVQRKLIQRSEHKKDTRAKIVALTPHGKKMLLKIVPKIEKTDATFFENLSTKEQAIALQLFKKLTA